MQKKMFTLLTRFARSAASAASGEAQPYLPLRSLRSLRLRALRSHYQSLCSIRLRTSRSLCSLGASRFPLAFSVASLPRNFQKKKCVSIDSKWSKTHKNAKKNFFTPLTRFARSDRSERRSATIPTSAVASLPRVSRFALAFSVASLHRASGFGLRASRSRSRFSVASLPRASRFALATYPMSLPGSQGVSMPSFMSIGPKLWAL